MPQVSLSRFNTLKRQALLSSLLYFKSNESIDVHYSTVTFKTFKRSGPSKSGSKLQFYAGNERKIRLKIVYTLKIDRVIHYSPAERTFNLRLMNI